MCRNDTFIVTHKGLHVPRIRGDEVQIFPMEAFVQLRPTYNSWEPKTQQFFCGVPNGVREGSVMYFLDQVSKQFKKYRIPAHENPYFTRQDNEEALRQYGGEDTDDYQHLVLGMHGSPTFSVIPRSSMKTESYPFYSYRYTHDKKISGMSYSQAFDRPDIKHDKDHILFAAIDTGYSDPTVIQIIGKIPEEPWKVLARYRLTRIAFPEQAEIIDWLHQQYNFDCIAIDFGAGGGGMGIAQDLTSSRFKSHQQYKRIIQPVMFGSSMEDKFDLSAKFDSTGRVNAKSFGGQELARMISDKELVFSEMDIEGMSQLERVASQRKPDGGYQYFVMSERGSGKSNDDHILASYIVFIIAKASREIVKIKAKLFSAAWV